MAPTKAELAPWKWVEITKPEKVKLDHILQAYRLSGACLPRCPYKCIRNCRKNPYCLWCLGEKAWTTSGSEENSDEEANLEFRREDDFVGIINLGTTCYVNALLQLWFHNPIIRPAILSWHPTYAVNLDSKLDPLCPLGQLQAMFARMKFSKRSAINPTTLIESLNLDVGEQQDAQEFAKLFMSMLSHLASEGNVSKELTRAFEGTWKYETECKVCTSKTFTKEKFTELDLCVMGAKDTAASFATLFTEEELVGDNQYLCQNCVGKTDAIRRFQLLKLPPVLNIQLLRFIYDKDTRRKKKVTTPYTFPEYLDMAPYVQTSSTCGTSGTSPSTSNNPESSDNTHKYQLTGYLVHNGRSASSGHYVAHIRDIRSGAWHIFNDEAVSEQKASKSDAKSVAKKDKEEEDSTFKVEKTGDYKSTGAYMLVYTHQSLIESPPPDPDIPEYLKNLIELEDATFESEIQTTKKEREMKAQYLEDRKNSVEELYKLLIPGKKPSAALTLCQNEGDKQLQNQDIDSQEKNSQNVNTNPKDKDGENIPPRLSKGKENQNNPFGKKVKDAKTAKDSKHENTLEAISKAKEYQIKFPVSELDFLPYTWMTSWLNQTVETVPLLATKDIRCPHSKLALPSGMASVPYKVVPSTVADILYAKYGGESKDSDSGLTTGRLQGEDALCSECVITECRQQRFLLELDVDHKKVIEMSAATGKKIENHNKFAGMDGANFSHEFWEDKVWVSKLSLRKWRTWARSAQIATTEVQDPLPDVTELNQGPTVQDLNAEIMCPHGKLSTDAGLRKTVDLVTWSILEKHFPASTMFGVSASMPCTTCQDLENQNHQVVLENKKLADKIKDLLNDLIKTKNRPPLDNPGEYYFITESFFREIISFTKNPERKESPLFVDNGDLFCSCSTSLFKYPIEIIEKLKQEMHPVIYADQHDDQLEQWCLLWPQEWEFLHELFTCKPEDEIKVTIAPTSSGVGYEYYPGVCESCSQAWGEEKHREMSIFTDQPIYLQHQDSEEIVIESQSIDVDDDFDEDFKVQPATKKKKTDESIRRSGRSRVGKKEKKFYVSSDYTIKNMKFQLVKDQGYKFMASDVTFYFNDKEITNDEATLASLGVCPGARIKYKTESRNENEDSMEVDSTRTPETGFAGTLLQLRLDERRNPRSQESQSTDSPQSSPHQILSSSPTSQPVSSFNFSS